MDSARKPSVTVGFFPRERFALAAASLRSIVRNTEIPFRLIIVDCGIPERYRGEMEAALAGHEAEWLRSERFLLPNQSKNLVCAVAQDDYLCLIENDCLVQEGWLSRMIEACERLDAGAAFPLIYDGPTWRRNVHHERGFASMEKVEVGGRVVYRVESDTLGLAARWRLKEPQVVTGMENHCVLYRRETLEAIGPFEEAYSIHVGYDVAARLLDKGIPMLMVPTAVINHFPPSVIRRDEEAFYDFRWDLEKVEQGFHLLRSRRAYEGMSDGTYFARGQKYRKHPVTWQLHRLTTLPRYAVDLIRSLL